jgi:hypothetical protein
LGFRRQPNFSAPWTECSRGSGFSKESCG